MSVLHLSFDYPDSIAPRKTKAVLNLARSQEKFPNFVISLNRISNPFGDFKPKKEDFGYSMNLFGLPFGIGLNIWMYLAYRKIAKIIRVNKIDVQLIHAHKLTYEGLIAIRLSEELHVPYVVTVRGGSDIKVIEVYRFMKETFREVLEKCEKVIFLAPWTQKALQRLVEPNSFAQKSVTIPNIIDLSALNEPGNISVASRFVSVLHFDHYSWKNLRRVIRAIDVLSTKYPDITLDIVGWGKDKSVKTIKGYISACKFPEKFRLLGYMEHKEVLAIYRDYSCFILPSYPETFGMVFIEALSAGLPVIYAEGSGIDGHLDGLSVGVKVPWKSDEKIREAIGKIYEDNASYRQNVRKAIERGDLDIFSKARVSEKYTDLVSEVVERPQAK